MREHETMTKTIGIGSEQISHSILAIFLHELNIFSSNVVVVPMSAVRSAESTRIEQNDKSWVFDGTHR